MCTAPLRGLDDIVRVLLPIFGNKEFPLQTTKNLDFLSWKKAIHIKRNSCPRSVFPLEGSGTEETKAGGFALSQKHGDPINIYEKVSGEFSLIGSFVSRRKAAQFLEISAGTVTRYMQSGKLFKDKYKFSRR